MKIWSMLFLVLLLPCVSCSKAEPARTDDPAEIEKQRQKHQSMAEREMSDG